MVRWNTGTSEEMTDPMDAQQKTPTRPMSTNPDLDMVRMRATKDIAEGERDTGGSGEIGIIHDDGANETTPRTHGTLYRNILYLDGTPFNIEIGGRFLQEVERKKGDPLMDRLSGHALIIMWGMD